MKIDLKITWDDLTDECKDQIENLKKLGIDIKLVWPEVQKDNNVIATLLNNNQWTYMNTNTSNMQPLTINKPNSTTTENLEVYCNTSTVTGTNIN